MTNVVQQRGGANDSRLIWRNIGELPLFVEQSQRFAREMMRAKRMLKSRMRGAGIHEVRQAELTHIAQALHDERVEQRKRECIQPNVIPQRVAQDIQGRVVYQRFGPAARISGFTAAPNFLMFS